MSQATPGDDVPVYPKDLVALFVVSLFFGLLIAAWLRPIEASAEFVFSVSSGAVLLMFFLFVPVMGIRLFFEDWKDDENED
ncbi:hypothetical protein [Natronobacterium texcoconense]|uniref:Uncharacterized protein n=1 Tax=Natronobacterium texcoconense TaxID=1095778 RepID=A0A1H1GU55_NATTX|nr:hypothetical protein [Natronobacterium texcoconense]SDR16744.1 hypothetical protein SAMN04489842_2615 [Natronobacterium texcoconense]